ncbi:MAG: outer membrane protein [Hyphomicrobiaceae bacterium]
MSTWYQRVVLVAVVIAFISQNKTSMAEEYGSPSSAWLGFYVGGHGGYGWGRIVSSDYSDGRLQLRGGLAGGHVGFNLRYGDMIYGIEGDASLATLSKESREFDAGEAFLAKLKNTTNVSVRARVGWAHAGTLLFATAGVGFAHLKLEAVLADYMGSKSRPEKISLAADAREFGFIVGAGVERTIAHDVTGRVEVLHHAYSDNNFEVDGYKATFDYNATVLRVGGSLHLN